MRRLILASVSFLWLGTAPAAAATITNMLFVQTTNGVSTLERVAFNGTQLGTVPETIATLSSTWDVMSYDEQGGFISFVRTNAAGTSTLERPAFDGSSLGTVPGTVATLSSRWDAMSLGTEPIRPQPVPAPGSLPILTAALAALAMARARGATRP